MFTKPRKSNKIKCEILVLTFGKKLYFDVSQKMFNHRFKVMLYILILE